MRTQSIIRCFLLVIVLGWSRFTADTSSAGDSLQKAASAKNPLARTIPLPVKEMRPAGSYQAGIITITDVTSISNGSFNAGDVINIQVHLSATVIVNGTPRLRLTTNEPLTT